MKHLQKLLMVLLSYVPIATVAVAAQAKANELTGEIQSVKIKNELDGARFRLLPTYQMGISLEDSRKRYIELTGLKGEQLDYYMARDLYNLASKGLIQFDEKKIVAMGPSEHASY